MYDREKWVEQKEQKLQAARAALEEGLKALETDEDWKKVLRAMAVTGKLSVGRFSFTNQLLIQIARPGTTHAATFARWQQHERSVKKGERALTVLQPIFRRAKPGAESADDGEEDNRPLLGFRPLPVFAIDQTEGEPLPEAPRPDFTAPEPFSQSVARLRAILLGLPGEVVTRVDLRPRTDEDLTGALGWYVPRTKEIVVLTDLDRAHQLKTLLHEGAHALLHGVGDHHSRPECEVEAESTAFVVCHALGLDTSGYSFPYVASWAGAGERALKAIATSGQRITRAATTILDALFPEQVEAQKAAAA